MFDWIKYCFFSVNPSQFFRFRFGSAKKLFMMRGIFIILYFSVSKILPSKLRSLSSLLHVRANTFWHVWCRWRRINIFFVQNVLYPFSLLRLKHILKVTKRNVNINFWDLIWHFVTPSKERALIIALRLTREALKYVGCSALLATVRRVMLLRRYVTQLEKKFSCLMGPEDSLPWS